MSFKYVGQDDAAKPPRFNYYLWATNTVIEQGAMFSLEVTDGTTIAYLATAGNPIWGAVSNIYQLQGDYIPVLNSVTGQAVTSMTTPNPNTTIYAQVNETESAVYSGLLSAKAGTTFGSDQPGFCADLTNALTINEGSYAFATAQMQNVLFDNQVVDPSDPSGFHVFCKIHEKQTLVVDNT